MKINEPELISRKGNVGFYKLEHNNTFYFVVDERKGKLRSQLLGAVKTTSKNLRN